MLTLKGIQRTMDKLNRRHESGESVEGEIVFDASRGSENRYSYYYKGQLVFTFGITRSPRQKSKQFHYVHFVQPHTGASLVFGCRAKCICNGRNIDVCMTALCLKRNTTKN